MFLPKISKYLLSKNSKKYGVLLAVTVKWVIINNLVLDTFSNAATISIVEYIKMLYVSKTSKYQVVNASNAIAGKHIFLSTPSICSFDKITTTS